MQNRRVQALPRWILALIALIPLAGALAGAARYVKDSADSRYVLQDSFVVHRAGEALTHQADSLNYASDKREMLRILRQLDSSDRCRRGQPGFCR